MTRLHHSRQAQARAGRALAGELPTGACTCQRRGGAGFSALSCSPPVCLSVGLAAGRWGGRAGDWRCSAGAERTSALGCAAQYDCRCSAPWRGAVGGLAAGHGPAACAATAPLGNRQRGAPAPPDVRRAPHLPQPQARIHAARCQRQRPQPYQPRLGLAAARRAAIIVWRAGRRSPICNHAAAAAGARQIEQRGIRQLHRARYHCHTPE